MFTKNVLLYFVHPVASPARAYVINDMVRKSLGIRQKSRHLEERIKTCKVSLPYNNGRYVIQ